MDNHDTTCYRWLFGCLKIKMATPSPLTNTKMTIAYLNIKGQRVLTAKCIMAGPVRTLLRNLSVSDASCFLHRVSGRLVSGECQGEMMDYRRMLMEDFSLSPEIVLHCRSEIELHCSGLHRKGRTLHCLMRVGRGDVGAIDVKCQNAVRNGAAASRCVENYRLFLIFSFCCFKLTFSDALIFFKGVEHFLPV